MFNKLKSFSEDVAKSFNDIQQGDPGRRNADAIKQLKSGSSVLNTKTPDSADLTQPEDESVGGKGGKLGEESATGENAGGTDEQGSDEALPIASSGPLKDVDMNEIPPFVRAKLRKFAKYEDKYPVLLDAYKTEKRKAELVNVFEKVLRECTPVSSIADAGLLMDFLKNLSEKSSMLEAELRKSTAEATNLTKEKTDLAKKLADAEKTVKYAEASVGKLAKLEEQLQLENQQLKSHIVDLESAVEKHKRNIAEIEEKAKLDLAAAQEKTRERELETDVTPAENDPVESADPSASVKDADHAAISRELETATKYIEDSSAKLAEKEKDLEKLQFELRDSQEKITELSKSQGQLSELQKAKQQLDSDHANLKAELSSSQLQLTKSQDELKVLKQTQTDSESEVTKLKNQIEELQDQIRSQTKEIGDITQQRDALELKLNTQEEKLASLTVEIEQAAKKAEELEKSQVSVQAGNEPVARVTSGQPGAGSNNKKKKKKGKAAPTQELPKQEESPEKLLDRDVTGEDWKQKFQTVNTNYETLLKEKDTWAKELSETKRQLASKEEEIELLRDLLKDLGNDLVTAKDDLKTAKGKADAELADKVSVLEQKEHQLIEEAKQKEEHIEIVGSKLKQAEEDLKVVRQNLNSAVAKGKKADDFSAQLESTKKELTTAQAELETATKDLQDSRKEESKSKAKITELVALVAKLEGELESAKKEIASLKDEKQKLNERVGELTKFKSADSSLKLEIASLQASISHKDEQIRELKDLIEKKNKERDELNSTISSLKTSNSDLSNTNRDLVAEKSNLINKQEMAFERTNSVTAELTKLQVSRQKVSTDLEALKLKYDALLKTRASSSDEIQSFKQQYDELNMKVRDSQLKIDNLEDDLSEAKHMLQERTRESSMLRTLLMDAEEQCNIKCGELKNEIRTINEERQELESNLLSAMKKKQREVDEAKATADGYLVKIRDMERKCEELKEKYEPLMNGTKSPAPDKIEREKDLETTIDELRASLQASSKKVQDYENLNRILKKLNEELTLKFERLSKNYKHITQQYRQMQSQNTAPKSAVSSARSSVDEKRTESNETNVAYLKNVLLGFFEHREQRGQLLPVVKTLFHFDDVEEQKLLNALK